MDSARSLRSPINTLFSSWARLIDRAPGSFPEDTADDFLFELGRDVWIAQGFHRGFHGRHEMVHEMVYPTRAPAQVPLQALAITPQRSPGP